jgi:hypothetical protein
MIALSLRVNVVGYDYTGYGASKEFGIDPTEKQTYKDIERVYEWCLESKLVKVPIPLRFAIEGNSYELLLRIPPKK